MIIAKNDAVSLRVFIEEDIDNKIKWINDPKNNQHLHYDIPLEKQKTLNWFKNKDDSKRLDLVIEYDGVPVGLIGLLNIDEVNSKAEYYICLGEHSYKQKGIASVSTRLLLNHAFLQMNLNKVYLNVDSDNSAACRLYEKCGFLCEGVFIKDLFHRGQFINRKRYAILRDDFLEGVK